MLEFLQDIEVEVIERFDEEADEIAESSWERFALGEQVDADVVGEIEPDDASIQIQFGDGSVTWLPKGSFKVIT